MKSWEDIVFFYSVEESVSLSAPKYNIPFSSRNNRTDVFASPKGVFFDKLNRPDVGIPSIVETNDTNGTKDIDPSEPTSFAVLITDSSGHTKEFKNEGDFMLIGNQNSD